MSRKLWVKRPEGQATLVYAAEHDIVDGVKDLVIRKYANSLGRDFDAPEVVLRIIPRDKAHALIDRILLPEEQIWPLLETYYPGGQNAEDALLIGIAPHSTPETCRDRAPPPNSVPHRPREKRHYQSQRPRTGRSSSPLTSISSSVVQHYSYQGRSDPAGSQIQHDKHATRPQHIRATPTPETRLSVRNQLGAAPPLKYAVPLSSTSSGIRNPYEQFRDLNCPVPPINVLIVEDNMINLKILTQMVKRLGIHWQTAVNGLEAVTRWRSGGFHLVLMDIQMPVMDGLEATKEIRRLERMDRVEVLSEAVDAKGSSDTKTERLEDGPPATRRTVEGGVPKSPIIIVALTASSLQSDRHEALAAGCNDFLTKPVDNEWLRRKIIEWGCMQALVDFNGWRDWKNTTPVHEDSCEASV